MISEDSAICRSPRFSFDVYPTASRFGDCLRSSSGGQDDLSNRSTAANVTCTTSDPQAAAAFIRNAHGIEGRIAGLRRDRPVTLSHVVIGPVSLGTAHLPCSVEFESESSSCYVVSHLKSGSMRLGRDTRAETCAPGDIVLAIRPGRPCRAHLVDAEVSVAALTPDALADVVGDEDDGREPVRFLSGRPGRYMFRRHLDTSPMTYLRQIRLRRAHRDLLTGDPTRDTVAEVAIRWGFAHTGRFSQVYRIEFGQSPSVTLRG